MASTLARLRSTPELHLHKPSVGFEPTTIALQIQCSTSELRRPNLSHFVFTFNVYKIKINIIIVNVSPTKSKIFNMENLTMFLTNIEILTNM